MREKKKEKGAKHKEINKYEIMWMFVMFDLPVTSKEERKAATDFRCFLLDNGFAKAQYSVYIRVFSGKDACQKYYKIIERAVPPAGKVEIVLITDMQYSNIVTFEGREKSKPKQPEQLLLF